MSGVLSSPNHARWWLLTAALALTMFACERLPSPDEPQSPARIVFEMRSEELTRNDCIAGSGACTYVRVDYPAIVEAPPNAAVDVIERTVRESIRARYMEDGIYRSPTELMRAFLAEYEAMVEREPGYTQPWFLERKAFVLNNQPHVLSLSFFERAHTGGAHETSTLSFKNLHPETGASVSLSDFLAPGYEHELEVLAEAKFRTQRGIEDGQSLADAGFVFDDDVFALTDNVAIEEDRLTFYYNPYDVAPYALGSTEIHVSFTELGPWLKERGHEP